MCHSAWCPGAHVGTKIETGLHKSPDRKARKRGSKPLVLLLLLEILFVTRAAASQNAVLHWALFGTEGKKMKMCTDIDGMKNCLCVEYRHDRATNTTFGELKITQDSGPPPPGVPECDTVFTILYGKRNNLALYGKGRRQRLFVERECPASKRPRGARVKKQTAKRNRRRRKGRGEKRKISRKRNAADRWEADRQACLRRSKHRKWSIRSMPAGHVYDTNLDLGQHSDFEFEYVSCLNASLNVSVDAMPQFRIRLGDNATYVDALTRSFVRAETAQKRFRAVALALNMPQSTNYAHQLMGECGTDEKLQSMGARLATARRSKKVFADFRRFYKRKATRFRFESVPD